MSRLFVAVFVASWSGSALLFTDRRWFGRPPLHRRVQPYLRGRAVQSPPPVAGPTTRALVASTVGRFGQRIAGALGVGEDLATRLDRIHAPFDPATFRLRQMVWAIALLGLGATLAQLLDPPLAVILLLLVGGPALAVLVLEQQIATASRRWQHRVFLELPVVSEQLGMLLGAGFSLSGSLNRIAERGQGACASDLRRVCARLRQGIADRTALEEWAELVEVDAVDRLVHVLTMNHETTDLGGLVAEEARAARSEAHRETLEILDRRTQQVWIPVTVATLVPVVLLLAVPFIEAMRLFTAA